MKQVDDYTIIIGNKIIRYDIKIRKAVEFNKVVVVLIREDEGLPNNIIAYDLNGNPEWKINDIIQAKKIRGFYDIEKVSDSVLKAYYDLAIVYDIDIDSKTVLKKEYMR